MAVKIIRMQNGIALDYIKHLLLPADECVDQEDTAQGLKQMLEQNKDYCYFSVMVDGEEVLTFILAYVLAGTRNSMMFQFYVCQELKPRLVDAMFARYLLWCEQMGIESVIADDLRTSTQQQENWGFVIHKTIRKLGVTDALNDKLVNLKENTNGTTAATNTGSAEPAEPATAVPASDRIRDGSDGTGERAGVGS